MKKKYTYYLLLLIPWLTTLSFNSYAQEDTTRRDKEFANPSVEGTPRGKFLIFKYQRFFDYRFNSTAANNEKLPVGNADAQVKNSNIAEIKGFIPLWNRPHFKTVLGLGYEREEYNFEKSDNNTYLYHQNLQDKGLKSLSAQLAFLHPMNYKNYMIFRVKGQLNGDYTSNELNFNDYLKVTAEVMYGWKKSKYFSWGLGAQLGYTFGRQTIYPAILYNRTFNNHWGVEAVFPANIKMRYTPSSDKSYFYFGYELDGYSYNIKVDKFPFSQSPIFSNIKTIELRHNDVKLQARWEKEIYDFLWFGLEGGYRMNIAYDAFESGSERKTTLIETDAGGAPFAEASIFFVVPRAFLKR
jgi:hypothetical protein